MKHVDEWLDEPAKDEAERLAKEWIEHSRRSAMAKDHDWMNARVLTCTFEFKRWRCIGASRLGDVWLTADFTRTTGYDRRVDVTDCSDWKVAPASPAPAE